MRFVGIDLETLRDSEESPTGVDGSLEPHGNNKDRISLFCASSTTNNLLTLEAPTRARIEQFLQSLDPVNDVLVAHNLVFESGWLCSTQYSLYADLKRFRLLDSMLLLKRWNMMQGLAKFDYPVRYGLKQWVAKFYPEHADYGAEIDFKDGVTKELKFYCAKDALFCARIAEYCFNKISPLEQTSSFMEGRQCLEMGVSWQNGITIDVEYLDTLKQLKEIELLAKLEKTALAAETLNSPKQLKEYIYNTKGLHSSVKTKPSAAHPEGQLSTSKKALVIAAREYEDPQLITILSYRQTRTELKKFIDGAIKATDYSGGEVIYPVPHVAATYTGRGSYSTRSYKGCQCGIALHQIPRDKTIKKLIVVPEGYQIVACDFASQEIRVLAALQKDVFLIDVFKKGLDFHSITASNLINMRYDEFIAKLKEGDEKLKGLRFTAKVVGLSSLYRISTKTMRDLIEVQYGLNMSLDEAEASKETFFDTYRGIKSYWEKAVDSAYRNGYAKTISGRRIRLKDMDEYPQQQTAINFPIQGSAADMKLLAVNSITDKLASMNGKLYFELHDCLYMLLPDDSTLVSNAKELQHDLSNLDYKKAYNWEPPVAFPTDCAVGYSFGSLEELK